MNEDDVMFQWGIGLAAGALILTALLQVSYRIQDKTRARIRADIVRTQQDIAVASANFSSFVRPEILRNLVYGVYPNSVAVGFNKTVSIDELPYKEAE